MTTMTPNMIGRCGLAAVSALALLTGCVTGEPTKPTFVRAVAEEPPTIEAKIEPKTLPAFQQTLKRIDDDAATDAPDGLAAIEAARKEALIASAPDGFLNATQYFPYEDGALYELHAASGFLSMIQLQPGEKLVNYAAGDTARWTIGDVTRGDQTLLLVKPTRPESQYQSGDQHRQAGVSGRGCTAIMARPTMPAIAWTYPIEEVSRQVAAIETENERRNETVVTGVPVEQLDFDYEIEGDKPSWRPVRAFSDGSKTYIEFPKTLGTAEAPPLFLNDENGSGQLVNYRVKQNYYIVDRLFDQAELRLDGTVVSISKAGSSGWSRWFGSGSKPPSNDRRGCTLCRDTDDHGDNDRGHHDSADHHGMS